MTSRRDGYSDQDWHWFNYGDTRLGQGRDNARTYLQENPALADEIEAKIRGAVEASAASESDAGTDEAGDGA